MYVQYVVIRSKMLLYIFTISRLQKRRQNFCVNGSVSRISKNVQDMNSSMKGRKKGYICQMANRNRCGRIASFRKKRRRRRKNRKRKSEAKSKNSALILKQQAAKSNPFFCLSRCQSLTHICFSNYGISAVAAPPKRNMAKNILETLF